MSQPKTIVVRVEESEPKILNVVVELIKQEEPKPVNIKVRLIKDGK